MAELSAHDAAMVAKVDAVAAAATVQAAPTPVGQAPAVVAPADPAAAPAVVARPDKVPEKFWDATKGAINSEALLASYAELEAKQSGAPAAPAGAPVAPVDGTPEAAVAAAKLDMGTLASEYASAGVLSEASYAALEKAGVNKATVDTYIAGQQALAEKSDRDALTAAGVAPTEWSAMQAWASQAMPDADKAALNASLAAGGATAKQALVALKAQYVASKGSEPNLLKGGNGESSTGAFASRAEVTTAMRDPRYKADPAYRAEVERRIGLMEVF